MKRSGKLGGVNRAARSEDLINKLPSVVVAGAGQTAAEDQRGSVTHSVFVSVEKFNTFCSESTTEPQRLPTCCCNTFDEPLMKL